MQALRKLFKRFWYQVAIFLAVLSPGLITANVDNDAGGIYTDSQAGATLVRRWNLLHVH